MTDVSRAADPTQAAERRIDPSFPPQTVSQAGVGDAPTASDALGFKPYVAAVAAFMRSPATKPPFTLSIEGSWGSGKSSFLMQLKDMLRSTGHEGEQRDGRPTTKTSAKPALDFNVPVIEFNAWRNDKEDALWASFALEFIEQLEKVTPLRARLRARLRLLKERFSFRRAAPRLAKLLVLIVLLATVAIAAFRVIRTKDGRAAIANVVAPGQGESTMHALLAILTTGGGLAGVLILSGLFLRTAAEAFGNPLKIELREYIDEPDYSGRIAFAERFHRDFERIVRAYAAGRRIYVFIDDLDRCEIPKAAELLQALHILLATESEHLVFVVALDRDIIAAALAAKYSPIIPYLSALHPAPITEPDDRASAARAGIDYGHDFLEKLIQLPFRVPEPAPANIDKLLDSLKFTKPAAPADTPRVPQGLIDIVDGADSERMREIVRVVAPSLDYNPRRIKQFIGMFRLHAYIGGTTELLGEPTSDTEAIKGPVRLETLGKFVALSLRWPRLVAEIERDHTLLARLQRRIWTVDEPDPVADRWLQEPGLRQFFGLGVPPEKPIALYRSNEPYRLDMVNIEALLRVSPARQTPAASTVHDDAVTSQSVNAPSSANSHALGGVTESLSRTVEQSPGGPGRSGGGGTARGSTRESARRSAAGGGPDGPDAAAPRKPNAPA